MGKAMCPICANEPNVFLEKSGVLYAQCASCKTVFCGVLDQDNKVGGEHEIERNEKENNLRINRIDELCFGIPLEERRILDFGCGHGYMIEDLKKAGYIHVEGYDPYTEEFRMLPKKESYHVVIMTEVIEHTSPPFLELDVIYKSLVNYGAVLVESGFIDVCERDNIKLEDYFYINPNAGHSTILSHHGIDVLMCKKGFVPRQHFNLHVRCFQKILK